MCLMHFLKKPYCVSVNVFKNWFLSTPVQKKNRVGMQSVDGSNVSCDSCRCWSPAIWSLPNIPWSKECHYVTSSILFSPYYVPFTAKGNVAGYPPFHATLDGDKPGSMAKLPLLATCCNCRHFQTFGFYLFYWIYSPPSLLSSGLRVGHNK